MSISEFYAKSEELKDSIMYLYAVGDTSYAEDMNRIAGICKTIDNLRIAYANVKEDCDAFFKTAEDLQNRLNSLESKEKDT